MHVYQGLLLISPLSGGDSALPVFVSQRQWVTKPEDSDFKKEAKKEKREKSEPKSGTSRRGSLPLCLPSSYSGNVKRQQKLYRAHKWSTVTQLYTNTAEHDSNKVKNLLRTITRLWCHESTRVFADRLTDSRDHVWFIKLLETCLKYCFCGVSFTMPVGEKRKGNIGTELKECTTSVASSRRMQLGRQRLRKKENVTAEVKEETLVAELLEAGVRIDVLCSLLPHCVKLLEYNEIVVKGEDVSGLMFIQMSELLEREKSKDVQKESTSKEGIMDRNERQVINFITSCFLNFLVIIMENAKPKT